ncbi:MAG: penicillin-binding protein activator [Firmicutes bacterium]|nr:penicillin-binding protein activator [Bacillota bacterium]MCL5038262.1 penicillin-binding protein activator [Bacillota bacterium]
MTKNRMLALFLSFLLVASLAGCGAAQPAQPQKPTEGEKVIRIGLVSPLSGSVAYYGGLMRDGAAMAIKEINDAGGLELGGKKFKIDLKVEDDRGSPSDSVNAVEKLTTQDKVTAVIGSYLSTATLANLAVTEKYGLVQITPVSVADAITKGHPYMFRNVANQTMQTVQNAEWVAKNTNFKNVAMFLSNDDYGREGGRIWKETFEKDGGKVVDTAYFNLGDTEFTSQLTKIKAKNPDAIFLVALITEGSQIIKQARDLGMNQTFIGLGGFASDKFLELVKGTAEGMIHNSYWEPDPKNPKSMEYKDKFVKFSGKEAEMFGAAAYDAAYIVTEAMKRVGEFPMQDKVYQQKLREAMLKTDYLGVQGRTTFDANGQANMRVYIVKIINGKRTIVGP